MNLTRSPDIISGLLDEMIDAREHNDTKTIFACVDRLAVMNREQDNIPAGSAERETWTIEIRSDETCTVRRKVTSTYGPFPSRTAATDALPALTGEDIRSIFRGV